MCPLCRFGRPCTFDCSRLSFAGSGTHVLLRADFQAIKAKQVTLLSGGGSGHEPSHGGWLGEGMLTAAVCGGVFASPSVDAVLSGIRACAGPHGVLVLVKNYTGDRLNFGLACEQAKAEGIRCEMIIVGDDCAVMERDEDKIAGRRGIAGTVFVHKCAGAAAAAGAPLAQVLAVATAAEQSVGSVGVALDVCSLPGQPRNDRLTSSEMEMGLGIHGEPGTQKLSVLPCDDIVDRMLSMICDPAGACRWEGGLSKDDSVVLLVNNLGSTPVMEQYVAARRAIEHLETDFGVNVARAFVGPFMTSLDMTGISLTLMKLSYFEDLCKESIKARPSSSLAPGWLAVFDPLKLLDAPTGAPAWPASFAMQRSPAPEHPVPTAPTGSGGITAAAVSGPGISPESAEAVKKAVVAAVAAVCAAEEQLTAWDAAAGDGDCGTTMKRGAEQVTADLGGYDFTSPSSLLAQLADSIGTMGGTSGVILDIFFRACGNSYASAETATDATSLLDAIEAGTKAITFYGGATEGMRTMLDAMLPAHRAGVAADAVDASVALAAMAEAAMSGAEATRTMPAVAGRAAYVPDQQVQGTPDPGAMAVAIALQAAAGAVLK